MWSIWGKKLRKRYGQYLHIHRFRLFIHFKASPITMFNALPSIVLMLIPFPFSFHIFRLFVAYYLLRLLFSIWYRFNEFSSMQMNVFRSSAQLHSAHKSNFQCERCEFERPKRRSIGNWNGMVNRVSHGVYFNLINSVQRKWRLRSDMNAFCT